MRCEHGVDIKHKACNQCEDIAKAEGKASTRKPIRRENASSTKSKAHVIDIDPDRLDWEWVNQPEMYMECATELAEARKNLEEAKANVDLVKADLDLDIRRNPGNYGLEDVKEKSISSCIELQPKLRKAIQKVIQCKYQVDTLDALERALEHRKRALEKLVDLRLADYFSSPRQPKGDAGEKFKHEAKREARTRRPGRD